MHGKNNPMYGKKYKHSSRTKEKIRKSLKGRKPPKAAVRAAIAANTGRKHTKKTRRLMSENHANFLGKNNPMYGKKLTKKQLKARSTRTKSLWKQGIYDHVKLGNLGKPGFRKDLGHFCRSTWEANFARILIYRKIKYEYEPHRIDCGKLGSYLPDFWLIDKSILIEIKGWENKDSVQIKKRWYLRNKYGLRVIVIRKRRYDKFCRKYKDKIKRWEH